MENAVEHQAVEHFLEISLTRQTGNPLIRLNGKFELVLVDVY